MRRIAVAEVEHGASASIRETAGIGSVDFEEIEDDPAQGFEVFGRMANGGLVVVSAEYGFQNPVAAVLDTPMLTDVALERGGRFIEAAYAVTDFTADFVTVELGALGFDVNQAEEIAPFSSDLGVHPLEAVVDRDASREGAAVGLFYPLFVTPALAVREIEIANGEVELILCFLMKVPLIAFEDEDVFDFLLHLGIGDVGADVHRIEGDDLAGQRVHLDEVRNGGDFVAFIRHMFLNKSESAFGCPSAHDVAGFGIETVAVTQPLALFESGMERADVLGRQRLKPTPIVDAPR